MSVTIKTFHNLKSRYSGCTSKRKWWYIVAQNRRRRGEVVMWWGTFQRESNGIKHLPLYSAAVTRRFALAKAREQTALLHIYAHCWIEGTHPWSSPHPKISILFLSASHCSWRELHPYCFVFGGFRLTVLIRDKTIHIGVVRSIPPEKFWNSASKYVTNRSFHIVYNSPFINSNMTRCRTGRNNLFQR